MRAHIFDLFRPAASATAAALVLAALAGPAAAQDYKPTIEDWVGVNEAINAYTLGLERKMPELSDRAFWDDAVLVMEPDPGNVIRRPAKQAESGPPPGASGARNVIGTDNPPWHLLISSSFQFQSPTRATHYGYFLSLYPDAKTRQSVAGLPGHYEDVLEKRGDEWRILERKTVINQK